MPVNRDKTPFKVYPYDLTRAELPGCDLCAEPEAAFKIVDYRYKPNTTGRILHACWPDLFDWIKERMDPDAEGDD